MEEHGIGSPVLSVSCRYRSMTHFFDDVIILPKVEIYTGVKLSLSYKVLDATNPELRAEGGKQPLLSKPRWKTRLTEENSSPYPSAFFLL